MGQYLNKNPQGEFLPAKGKAKAIEQFPGAMINATTPRTWQQNLVCVVDNGIWDAALWVRDKDELDRVLRSINAGDNRPMVWLIVPNAEIYVGCVG